MLGLIFFSLFSVLIAAGNKPQCIGRVALPEMPEDINVLMPQTRQGCLVEQLPPNQNPNNADVCRCLNSKPAVDKHQLHTLSESLRPTFEDLYIQKTGERFRSKIFSIFNDLVVLDARIKQGLGINQNYVSYLKDCRMGGLKESLQALESDASCPRAIFQKRKSLILGTNSSEEFSDQLQKKINSIVGNGVPEELQDQGYCMSYKGFMGIKEPPIQAFRDYQRMRSAPLPEPASEQDLESLRLSMLSRLPYKGSLYLTSPSAFNNYYYEIMTNNQGTVETYFAEYDPQREAQENRQDGMMSRLILDNNAFIPELRASTDANDFFFQKNVNQAMLVNLNGQCKNMFSVENLRSLFCQNNYPNMNMETLSKELGPEIYNSPLHAQLGDRINEITASSFLCQSDEQNRITTSNTYSSSSPFWEDMLSPQKSYQSDVEVLTSKFDRTKRTQTAFETLNEKFCDYFNTAGLTDTEGHMRTSSMTMAHARGMMEYYIKTYYGETLERDYLARLRAEIFPLLDQLPSNLNNFSNPNIWDQLQLKIKDIIGPGEVSAIMAVINRVARTPEREDLALRHYYKGIYPDAEDPLAAAISAKGTRASALADARANTPRGSSLDRLVNPSRYETGWTESATDSGTSIFGDYFVSGTADDARALGEYRSTISSAGNNSPLDMAWSSQAGGNSPTSASSEVPFIRSGTVERATEVFDSLPFSPNPIRDSNTGAPSTNLGEGNVAPTRVGNGSSDAPTRVSTRVPAAIPQAQSSPTIINPPLNTSDALALAPPVRDNSVGQIPSPPSDLGHPLEEEFDSASSESSGLDQNISDFLPPPVRAQNGTTSLGSGARPGSSASRRPAAIQSDSLATAGPLAQPPRSPFVPSRDTSSNVSELSQKDSLNDDKDAKASEAANKSGGAIGGGKKEKSSGKKSGEINGKAGAGKTANTDKKNKALKNIHAYEEDFIYPHGILETHMLGKQGDQYLLFHEFVHIMGLEGKRWSTIESIVDPETNQTTYKLRTFDLSWPDATIEQKNKLQDSDYRNKLITEINTKRRIQDAKYLFKYAQKTKLVREIDLTADKFNRMKIYLAGRDDIMSKILSTAIPADKSITTTD